MKTSFILLLFFAIFQPSAWAVEKFMCQCKAQGVGYEETNKCGGIDKICSYSCNCVGWNEKKQNGKIEYSKPIANINLEVMKTPTTAASKEQWDFGSHICHGQYSYKSNLDDPNWKTQVKFDTFTVNSEGEVDFLSNRRQISLGVTQVDFKFTKTAKEITENLAKQLKYVN